MLLPLLTKAPEQGDPVLPDVVLAGGSTSAPMIETSSKKAAKPSQPHPTPNFSFQIGSATDLPFPDSPFPVVSCIDVPEHLPLDLRERAVSSLTLVASRAVLIACPHGQVTHDCDEEFRQASQKRGRTVPNWVGEHLRQPYPLASIVIEQLQAAASRSGCTARVSLSYGEPASICRLVRRAAVRSDLLYASVNLLLGAPLPLIPLPDGSSGRVGFRWYS